jgi:transposase-like protein
VKKSRFTEEKITFALKQAAAGTRIDEICRKMGISDATFYKWRQKNMMVWGLYSPENLSNRRRRTASSSVSLLT